MRRALLLIATLVASPAHAGDPFGPPEQMTRFASLQAVVTRDAHLVETRAIAGLGQVWRYGLGDTPDAIVIAADGAWWLAPLVVRNAGQGMGGRFDELSGYHTRLSVTMIAGRPALAIDVEASSRLCHGRGAGDDPDVPKQTTCDPPIRVAATLACTRMPELACQFVAVE